MTVQHALSLTAAQIARDIKRVTYKPGWTFEVGQHPIEGPTLSIAFAVPNSYRQGEQQVQRVNSPIPPLYSREHVYAWLMWRISIVEMHELAEFFKVDGQMVYDPHSEEYWCSAALVYPCDRE